MTSHWCCRISAPPATLTSLRIVLNPGCHHHAVLDVSHLSDETTYNDLMQRMVASLNKCD
jgi:hypothetical protein